MRFRQGRAAVRAGLRAIAGRRRGVRSERARQVAAPVRHVVLALCVAAGATVLRGEGGTAEAGQRQRGSGQVFRDCAVCPEMVVLPAGRFRMGCVSGAFCFDDELPVREVRLSSFALSKHEVTFAEYDRFAAATGRDPPDDRDWGRGRRPVIGVSWEDAAAYADWLSEETGEAYRLPSEAEWEYAARAGTTTSYGWGPFMGRNQANCDGCGSRWDATRTAPVGSFAGNPWGLHDMHGNVWEWVADCWHADYAGAPSDGSAWTHGGNCNTRVVRGGSWYSFGLILRAAFRLWEAVHVRDAYIGIRLARSID